METGTVAPSAAGPRQGGEERSDVAIGGRRDGHGYTALTLLRSADNCPVGSVQVVVGDGDDLPPSLSSSLAVNLLSIPELATKAWI
jgi:hypothetical protein